MRRIMTAHTYLIALAIMLLLWPLSAHSRVWYVRNDGTGDAPTIQAAIDSAQAEDSIVVAPGIFIQPFIYCHKDSLTLMSEQGAGNTILQTATTDVFIISYATQIEVSGFCFEGYSGHGILAEYSTGITIKNNTIRNGGEWAILLMRSYDIHIQGNSIHSNARGIGCTDMCGTIEVSTNTISHNGQGAGIDFGDAYGCDVSNNIISFNQKGVFAVTANFFCNDVFDNDVNYDLLIGSDPTGTNGNISTAPLFCGVDPGTSGNYYLQQNSPCAPGNHPDGYSCGLIGAYPIGCQDTATRRATWSRLKALFGQ